MNTKIKIGGLDTTSRNNLNVEVLNFLRGQSRKMSEILEYFQQYDELSMRELIMSMSGLGLITQTNKNMWAEYFTNSVGEKYIDNIKERVHRIQASV